MQHQTTIIDQIQWHHSCRQRSMDDLMELAYEIGIDIVDDIGKSELIAEIWDAKSFTHTHSALAQRMTEYGHHDNIFDANDRI